MENQQANRNRTRQSRNNRRLGGVVGAAFLLLSILFGFPFAALSDNRLFTPVDNASTLDMDNAGNALRSRVVRINWNAIDPETSQLRLNLFEEVNLTVEFSRLDRSVTGGYVWVGHVTGEPDSVVTLSVQDAVLSGSVQRSGGEWVTIRYAGEG